MSRALPEMLRITKIVERDGAGVAVPYRLPQHEGLAEAAIRR